MKRNKILSTLLVLAVVVALMPMEEPTAVAETGMTDANESGEEVLFYPKDYYTDASKKEIVIDLTHHHAENEGYTKAVQGIWDEESKTWTVSLSDAVKNLLSSQEEKSVLIRQINPEIWRGFNYKYLAMHINNNPNLERMTLDFEKGVSLSQGAERFFAEIRGTKLKNLDNIDTSQVISMDNMFFDVYFDSDFKFPETWDTSKVTEMNHIFSSSKLDGCSWDFTKWNTDSLNEVNGIFTSATINNSNITFKDKAFPKVRAFSNFFSKTEISGSTIDLSGITFGESYVNSSGAKKPVLTYQLFYMSNIKDSRVDLKEMDFTHCSAVSKMFEKASISNSTIDMQDLDFKNANTVECIFKGSSVDSKSNMRISGWRLLGVNQADENFANAKWEGVGDLGISGWKFKKREEAEAPDRESRLKSMFENAQMPDTDLDLSEWDVSNFKNMDKIFKDAKLKALNVAGWDVRKATEFNHAFQGLYLEKPDKYEFDTKNISGWRPESANRIQSIFENNKQVKKVDLSGWGFPEELEIMNSTYPDPAFFFGMDNLEELKFNRFAYPGKDYGVNRILDTFSTDKYWVVELDAGGKERGKAFGPYRNMGKRSVTINFPLSGGSHTREVVAFEDSNGGSFDFKQGVMYKLHLRAEASGKKPKKPVPEEPKPEDPKPPVTPEDPNSDTPKEPEVTPTPEPPAPTPEPPTYRPGRTPDPRDPASPEVITVIGDDGVPLGTFKKHTNPDGTVEYINEDNVPLGEMKLVATGNEFPELPLMGVAVVSLLGVAFVLLRREGAK